MQHQNPPWCCEIFKIQISICISQATFLGSEGTKWQKSLLFSWHPPSAELYGGKAACAVCNRHAVHMGEPHT